MTNEASGRGGYRPGAGRKAPLGHGTDVHFWLPPYLIPRVRAMVAELVAKEKAALAGQRVAKEGRPDTIEARKDML